jgi:hypothetical protein
MDSSSSGRGRRRTPGSLAQLRFKTLNDLFPSRMHPKAEDDAPIVVDDEIGSVPTLQRATEESASPGLRPFVAPIVAARRNTMTSFNDPDLVPAHDMFSRRSVLPQRNADPTCILHPHSKARYYWDMTTLGMMAWVVIDVPFAVAFNVENPPNNGWDWHRAFGSVVDSFFVCDVVLNFNTGIEVKGGGVSLRRWDIAKDYATSWFLVDVVSAFPLDLVLNGSAATANTNGVLKLAKASRVVRQNKHTLA